MRKRLLATGITAVAFGVCVAGADPRTLAQSQCLLESRNYPETFIHISGANDAPYYEGPWFTKEIPSYLCGNSLHQERNLVLHRIKRTFFFL